MHPKGFLSETKVIQDPPGIYAGVVEIVEIDPDGILSDQFKAYYAYMPPACNNLALLRRMALYLRRGAMHSQEFRRK